MRGRAGGSLGQPVRGQERGDGVRGGKPGDRIPFEFGGPDLSARQGGGHLAPVEQRQAHSQRENAGVRLERPLQAGVHRQVGNPEGVLQTERPLCGLDPGGGRADIGARGRGAAGERLRISRGHRDRLGPDEGLRRYPARKGGERPEFQKSPVGRHFGSGRRDGDGGPFGREAGALGVGRQTFGHPAFEDADQFVEGVALGRQDARPIPQADGVEVAGGDLAFDRPRGREGRGAGVLRLGLGDPPPGAPLAAEFQRLGEGGEAVLPQASGHAGAPVLAPQLDCGIGPAPGRAGRSGSRILAGPRRGDRR